MAAAVAALGLFAARPTPILGTSGESLGSSVGSGTVSYRVAVNGVGCWTAVRTGGAGEGSRKRLSGCVNLLDVAF